jgi:hypothetical protein
MNERGTVAQYFKLTICRQQIVSNLGTDFQSPDQTEQRRQTVIHPVSSVFGKACARGPANVNPHVSHCHSIVNPPKKN